MTLMRNGSVCPPLVALGCFSRRSSVVSKCHISLYLARRSPIGIIGVIIPICITNSILSNDATDLHKRWPPV